MLRYTPILLIILYAAAMWFFSLYRLKAELREKSTPLTHPRLTPMLERLGRAMDLPPVKAHVYEIPQVNGLAAPDGRIFLTRGFLDRLDANDVTEAELASVIAHELGHVAHGHSRRRMVDFAGQNAIRMVLAGVLGRFLPGIGGWIANLAAAAVAARLSRQDEFEADAFASALMVKAGLGTKPQKDLFRKLEKLSGGRATAPAWLLSHPKTQARIEAIEKLEARWNIL
ncbi:M48 family metallopeptidase [Paracoccus shanxieyensis]|uniref:M48 family metalloprotease n=1 Tax=Paracoccus shanxieyensis TaxID=2675752 RepID=A0A6L6J209_9RHOB|nr:M48 family metallopeptidase [Paracoccus shanxieyensis]MTH64737.1 M48 family metalloprotease [Paracoccus shanxieyensis]MTH88030.1 M48 family metalloprotease [Paracoccus shanxieyensis]